MLACVRLFFLFIGLSSITINTIKAVDFNPYNNTGVHADNFTFKDYIQKFKPNNVWKEIDDINKDNNSNKTFKEEFENMYSGIDETDELLSLEIKNGDPKILLQKDGRRWKPPGDITENRFDPFSVRRRILELMKQAIYQTRNKMIPMQTWREKYKSISVYKMGFLFSKTDIACKTFVRLSFKAFKMCTMARQYLFQDNYNLMDTFEANERMVDLWFDIDLLIDLINLNHENCKRMLAQTMTNRKHAWKFVD